MKNKIIIGIFLLLAGFIIYALYNAIESYDKTVKQDWSSKALRNPFLAAEQFLQLRNINVETSNRLKSLDRLSDVNTLFISDSRHLRTSSRIQSLVEWMENGGRLIVGAQIGDEEDDNPLLNRFDIKKEYADCNCDDEDANDIKRQATKTMSEILREANKKLREKKNNDETEDPISEEEIIPESEHTRLTFNGIKEPVLIHFSQDTVLQHPSFDKNKNKDYFGAEPFYWESNQAGIQFAQFSVGKGSFTVLSESSIWSSKSINKLDHAYLLSILSPDNGKIMLLYGMKTPSIFVKLWRSSPEFLISAFLWLLMWIIYKSRRFGPVRDIDTLTRRSLEEHINACSQLLWRSKNSEVMISNLQTSIFRKIRHEYLNFDELDKSKQIEWISQKFKISTREVEQVLYSSDINDEESFYQIVRVTQKIGNKL